MSAQKIFWTITLILVLNMPAWAENIQPHLSVYGTASIDVTPDEMLWSLKVANRAPGIEGLDHKIPEGLLLGKLRL